jgi:cysteine-rich repeat protein
VDVCGDGQKPLGSSACDDGNTRNGDGCSSTCIVENGWTCSGGGPGVQDTCFTIVGIVSIE